MKRSLNLAALFASGLLPLTAFADGVKGISIEGLTACINRLDPTVSEVEVQECLASSSLVSANTLTTTEGEKVTIFIPHIDVNEDLDPYLAKSRVAMPVAMYEPGEDPGPQPPKIDAPGVD